MAVLELHQVRFVFNPSHPNVKATLFISYYKNVAEGDAHYR